MNSFQEYWSNYLKERCQGCECLRQGETYYYCGKGLYPSEDGRCICRNYDAQYCIKCMENCDLAGDPYA